MNCSACTDWQYRFRCKKRGKPSELNKLHRFSFNQPKTIRLKLLLDYDTKDKRFEAPLETQSFKYQTQGCRKKIKIAKTALTHRSADVGPLRCPVVSGTRISTAGLLDPVVCRVGLDLTCSNASQGSCIRLVCGESRSWANASDSLLCFLSRSSYFLLCSRAHCFAGEGHCHQGATLPWRLESVTDAWIPGHLITNI